jgi:hypothetical protein
MQRLAPKMIDLMSGLGRADVRSRHGWPSVIGPTADGNPILDQRDCLAASWRRPDLLTKA